MAWSYAWRYLRSALIYLLLALGAAFTAFPFFWMVSSSLKTPDEIAHIPLIWLPHHPVWSNYSQIWSIAPFGRMFVNSIVVTCAVTLGILITSSMAGFALAKYRFRGREFIFFSMLSTMMVPFFVLMIPLYYMMKEFGWLNSYWGLILPNIVTAFGIFLMRQFTFGVPTELLQAARIDGASEWWIYVRVVLPLTRPALAALGIFAFVYQWDSFLWPLLVVQSKSLWTVPLGVNSLRTFINAQQNMNLVMTGATLAVVPSLLVFLFLQKYFVKGITLSGFKG